MLANHKATNNNTGHSLTQAYTFDVAKQNYCFPCPHRKVPDDDVALSFFNVQCFIATMAIKILISDLTSALHIVDHHIDRLR